MKTLQNNFTTPEQSKRLLELGVPAWTADCFFGGYGGHPDYKTIRQTEFEIEDDSLFKLNDHLIPCWSVGRLIEIHRASTTLPEEQYMFPFWYDTQDNVEWAIRVLESGIRTCNINFSKLEE